MYNNQIFEDLNNPVFWFIAILGLYLWSLWMCIIAGVRQPTLEQFKLILVHKDLLNCHCKQPKDLFPPSYDQLYGDLPSYQEAVLLV